MARHFLTLADLSPAEIRSILQRAIELKTANDLGYRPFVGRTLAMLFTKSSTRTRVSFEVGMARLGGHALMLAAATTQLGRNEPLADTARVLSRMCDAIMIRNDSHADQLELAANSRVPVINGLSDLHHPCQLLADLQTWFEHRGEPAGKIVAWVGDGNNVCHSWIQASGLLDFELRIASPAGYGPDPAILAVSNKAATVATAQTAVADADLVVTDTWVSMGQESQADDRNAAFEAFSVNSALMKQARPDALFMHCLPVHRGEEVTAEVIDGPQSVVWDEAGNRLWAQMALLEVLLLPQTRILRLTGEKRPP